MVLVERFNQFAEQFGVVRLVPARSPSLFYLIAEVGHVRHVSGQLVHHPEVSDFGLIGR